MLVLVLDRNIEGDGAVGTRATITEISLAKSTKRSRMPRSPPIFFQASARSVSVSIRTWPLPS